MSKPIVHMMVVEDALARVKDQMPEMHQVLAPHARLAYFGSLSPDAPYASPHKSWADWMHKYRTGSIVRSALSELAGQGAKSTPSLHPSVAWAFGYMSHLAVDLTVHPVVNMIVEQSAPHALSHSQAEMVQDALLFHALHQRDIQATDYADRAVIHNDDHRHAAMALWTRCIEANRDSNISGTPQTNDWYTALSALVDGSDTGFATLLGKLTGLSGNVFYETESTIRHKRIHELTWAYTAVPLPGGHLGDFRQTVYSKAVQKTLEYWGRCWHALDSQTPDVSWLQDWDIDHDASFAWE